jgi:hypothetical protein
MPRIVKLRAPWADAEKTQEEIFTYTRKWRADTLGRVLRLTGAEWRVLRLRTIAPIDMTKEERRQDSQIRNRERQCFKRRKAGVKPRQEWEAASLSRTKPWERLGMSRRDWYRKGKPTVLAQVCSNKDKNGVHRPVPSQSQRRVSKKGWASTVATAEVRDQPTLQVQVRVSNAPSDAEARSYRPVPPGKFHD